MKADLNKMMMSCNVKAINAITVMAGKIEFFRQEIKSG